METGIIHPVNRKTVKWKQGLTPTFNGNKNTITKMQLKVTAVTFATPSPKGGRGLNYALPHNKWLHKMASHVNISQIFF